MRSGRSPRPPMEADAQVVRIDPPVDAVIAAARRPLVVLLDDLHWADARPWHCCGS